MGSGSGDYLQRQFFSCSTLDFAKKRKMLPPQKVAYEIQLLRIRSLRSRDKMITQVFDVASFAVLLQMQPLQHETETISALCVPAYILSLQHASHAYIGKDLLRRNMSRRVCRPLWYKTQTVSRAAKYSIQK